jgi:hypothetical protein
MKDQLDYVHIHAVPVMKRHQMSVFVSVFGSCLSASVAEILRSTRAVALVQSALGEGD